MSKVFYQSPIRDEKKHKRMQILVRPSLYKEIKRLSKERHISMNELINLAIELQLSDYQKNT